MATLNAYVSDYLKFQTYTNIGWDSFGWGTLGWDGAITGGTNNVTKEIISDGSGYILQTTSPDSFTDVDPTPGTIWTDVDPSYHSTYVDVDTNTSR